MIKIILIIFVFIPLLISAIVVVLSLLGIISLLPIILLLEGLVYFDKKKAESKSEDDLYREATQIVSQHDKVSTALLQRRLSIKYSSAEKIISKLRNAGVIDKNNYVKS